MPKWIPALGRAIVSVGTYGLYIVTALTLSGDTRRGINHYYPPSAILPDGNTATLPGFPGTYRVPNKNNRARWKDEDGNIFEWDSQHGKVENYKPGGKYHEGEFDPNTGQQTKPRDPGRKTDN